MSKHVYRPFRPAWSSPCLCGSGKRFRDCCHDRLPGVDIGKAWPMKANSGRWELAIKAMRADVAQYTIWHLSHTAPFKIHPPPMYRGKSLMKIDVEALSGYVETLMSGYNTTGREKAIPAMLDRLCGNIDDPAWHAKIAYHKAIERLWNNDRDGAIAELAKAGPITLMGDDVDLLQIQLDLHGGSMGLAETLGYMDRILELTASRADKIQYGGARAFQLIMTGDEKGGLERLLDVVRQGREMEAERPFGTRIEIWFCRALEGVAVITHAPTLFDEIVTRLDRLLAGTTLSSEGRARVSRGIGDAHRFAGKYELAIAAYREAYEHKHNDVLLAFEAECHLRLDNSDEALRVLRTVNPSTLDVAERTDCAFIYSYVALERKDKEALEMARDLLEAACTPEPYFERMRLSHIITLQDALAALAEKRPLPKTSGLSAFFRNVSRYIVLQPNFFGIGINLNNILDNIADQPDGREASERHGRGVRQSGGRVDAQGKFEPDEAARGENQLDEDRLSGKRPQSK